MVMHGSSSASDGLSISLPRSSAFTGCVSQNASYSNCMAVLTYRSIHGTSPGYLQSCFTRVADMTSRRRLRSSTSDRLDVPAVRLSTVGRRGVSGPWRQHLERSAVTCDIRAVTRGLQTTTQDIPVHSFISEHFYLTYFLTFSVDLATGNVI